MTTIHYVAPKDEEQIRRSDKITFATYSWKHEQLEDEHITEVHNNIKLRLACLNIRVPMIAQLFAARRNVLLLFRDAKIKLFVQDIALIAAICSDNPSGLVFLVSSIWCTQAHLLIFQEAFWKGCNAYCTEMSPCVRLMVAKATISDPHPKAIIDHSPSGSGLATLDQVQRGAANYGNINGKRELLNNPHSVKELTILIQSKKWHHRMRAQTRFSPRRRPSRTAPLSRLLRHNPHPFEQIQPFSPMYSTPSDVRRA
jgi:hypothetical protein